jgi:hypothetical protein
MKRSTREASRLLSATAAEQGGYFTSKQARAAGYGYPHLDYHVSCGNFVRVGHGLYRLPGMPPAEHDDLIRLALWSRDRQGGPQAVVSHESALVLHELSELLPTKTHLTVPPGFRKQAPEGCVLHRAVLAPEDVAQWQVFQITTPLRTLLDVARAGVSQEQLEKATADALGRGLVRQGKLYGRRWKIGYCYEADMETVARLAQLGIGTEHLYERRWFQVALVCLGRSWVVTEPFSALAVFHRNVLLGDDVKLLGHERLLLTVIRFQMIQHAGHGRLHVCKGLRPLAERFGAQELP